MVAEFENDELRRVNAGLRETNAALIEGLKIAREWLDTYWEDTNPGEVAKIDAALAKAGVDGDNLP
jgi:hypothetical protein